jgi:gas vesicle protein
MVHPDNQRQRKTQMENQYQEHTSNGTDLKRFLAGLLIGGLAGAGAMLLLAPQSGKSTRTQIQEKSVELRDQTVKAVEDTVNQVRTKANEITTNVHKQAKELQQRGQEMFDEQKERWSPVVEAGKTAVQGD